MVITGADSVVADDAGALARARRTHCHQLRILHNIRMTGNAITGQSFYMDFGGGVGNEEIGGGGGGSYGGGMFGIEESEKQMMDQIDRLQSQSRGASGVGGFSQGARSEGQIPGRSGYASVAGGSGYESPYGGGRESNRFGSRSTGGVGGGGGGSGSQSGGGGGGGYGSQSGGGVGSSYGSQSGGGNYPGEEENEMGGAGRSVSFGNRAASEMEELAGRNSSFGKRAASEMEELAGRNSSFGNRSSATQPSSVFQGRSRSGPGGGMQGRTLVGASPARPVGGGVYDPQSGRTTRPSLHNLHLRDVVSEDSRPAMVPVENPVELDDSATNLKRDLDWLKDLLLLYCVLGLTYLLYYLFFTGDKEGSRSVGGGCGCGPGEEVYDFVP